MSRLRLAIEWVSACLVPLALAAVLVYYGIATWHLLVERSALLAAEAVAAVEVARWRDLADSRSAEVERLQRAAARRPACDARPRTGRKL